MPGNFRGSHLSVSSLIASKERSAILGVIPATDAGACFSSCFGVESAQIKAIPKRSVCFLGRINGTDLRPLVCLECQSPSCDPEWNDSQGKKRRHLFYFLSHNDRSSRANLSCYCRSPRARITVCEFHLRAVLPQVHRELRGPP